jgi:ankyrin repeat protein
MNFKNCIKYLAYLLVAIGFSQARAGAYEDFFHAIEIDNPRAITSLLERGFDPNTRDERGQVGLYLAFRSPSLKAAQALWAHPGLDLEAANNANETPLMMAALKGETDWARKLVERGAKINREGWSPVHYAASAPEPAVLALLLDKGGDLNARSPNGTTPLMMAARYGNDLSVDLLLKRGADPTLRNQQNLSASDFARLEGREKLSARLAPLVR